MKKLMGSPELIQWFCLVNQHDGDVILDLIQQFALITDKPVFRFRQIDIPLALGARQNIQQLLTYGHFSLLYALSFLRISGFSAARRPPSRHQRPHLR